jgi:DNA-binding CsgD family transcriptional regulator
MIERRFAARGAVRWARVAALGRAAALAWLGGDSPGCARALARQRDLALGHPAAEVTAFTSAALLTAASGDPARARRDLAEAESRLHTAGVAALAPQWEQAALVCDWMAGDRDAALARTARLEGMPPPVPAAITLGLRAEVLRGSGRIDAARRLAGPLGGAAPAAFAAWALAGLDPEPAVALVRLRTATDAAWRDGRRGLIPLLLHRTAEIAAGAGRPEIAARAHADFPRAGNGTPLARVLAGLTESLVTGAAEPARLAHELAESVGMDLGGRPPGKGSLTPRERELTESVDTDLGARPPRTGEDALTPRERELARSVDTDLGGRPPRTGKGSLTPRERELAGLVRAGRTNRQIAEATHLSVKSVETYLTRVYAKTGCATRLELALAVAEGRVEADPLTRDARAPGG